MAPTPDSLPSLRREVARTLSWISAVWMALVVAAVAFGVRHEVDDLLDDALQESAELIYGLLVQRAAELPLGRDAQTMPAPPHDEALVWQLVTAEGRVALRSHQAPREALLPAFRPRFSDTSDGARVYAQAMPQGGLVLYVAQRSSARLEARYEAVAAVGAGGLLVSALCALWMQRRVRLALEPMRALSEDIGRFDPTRTGSRLAPPTRQEFVEVHQAIDALGRRLAQRVEREQAFAAHAAHALRTPLAGMEMQLAVALQEAQPQDRPRLLRAREAAARLRRVVQSLLTLFRSQVTLQPERVDLAALVAHLPAEPLQVLVEQDTDALVADPDLLAAALANLLDNAARYGASTVRIALRQVADGEGGGWRLRLEDDGPGVPLDRRAQLRGRLAGPVSDELGLGLRLALLIARAHGGTLSVDEPGPDEHGFSVSMWLWRDQRPPQLPAT